MKLQSKLIGSFATIASITLAIALFGYWQARETGHPGMLQVQTLVVAVVALGAIAAVSLAVFFSRHLSRPAIEMADAMDRVARGDLDVRVPVHSGDEFGRMAGALNRMIESVQTTEARLRRISDNLPNSLVYQLAREPDGSLRFLHISAGIERMHGLSAEAVRRDYQIIFQQYLEEDRALVAAAREASLHGMTVFSVVVRCRPPHGELRWMNLCAQPRRLADGRVVWDGIETDVTELKLATQRLQDSEARFRAVVENSAEAIATAKAGRVVLANPAFVALFGCETAEQVVDRPVVDFIASTSRLAIAADGRSREHGALPPARFEVGGLRRDGTEFEMELRTAGFSFAGERFVVMSLRDITERKRAEAQRVESVRLREQLLQGQKMETLGTLAAGIAHDFNNLLTGITGFIELAAASLPPGHEGVEMLRQAKQGATNARDLVRRILNFSKRSRETRRLPLDLGAVVRETMPLIAAVLPANVSISMEVADDTGSVLADAGQVQQVLMNLCTNGAHAIGTRAGTLRLGVDVYDCRAGDRPPPGGGAPGRYVRLTVKDSGSGMDESTRARIFAPFFTTKREGEGAGLGLYIVQDIVSRHKGWVEVDSAPGLGTTFAVYFPLAVNEAPAAPVPVVEAVVANGRGQKTLVVDDDASITAVLRLALTRGGYAPEVYTSPVAAWNRFAQAPGDFDLLLVDQRMPEMNGAEFVSRARTVAPRLPVILMSGRFEASDVAAETLGDGVAALKKPFDISEVLRQVRTSLGR